MGHRLLYGLGHRLLYGLLYGRSHGGCRLRLLGGSVEDLVCHRAARNLYEFEAVQLPGVGAGGEGACIRYVVFCLGQFPAGDSLKTLSQLQGSCNGLIET